jgi:hypothetical protein
MVFMDWCVLWPNANGSCEFDIACDKVCQWLKLCTFNIQVQLKITGNTNHGLSIYIRNPWKPLF